MPFQLPVILMKQPHSTHSHTMPTATGRWWQLVIAVICMMSISSPQYVWTLFTHPLEEKVHASLASVQVTFSLLIVLQTLFSPLQGWLLQRFGIRQMVTLGAALSGISWMWASQAHSLLMLYASYGILGGIGTGFVYLGTVALMVHHFPDRRGLAVGAVAAGYGFGAMLTTFPISHALITQGLGTTLLEFGAGLAVIGVLAGLAIKAPPPMPANASPQLKGRQYRPREMLSTPLFWLMFVMFVLLSTSGLMVTSQLAGFAADMGYSRIEVFALPAIPLALTLDRICNGLTRPLFGFISDHVGRENTMGIAFGLEACAMMIWLSTVHHPVAFVLLSGVVFLGWGEIFSLFPATLTDTFGEQHAATNYGFLYIAQGIGSILGGPLAALLYGASGSWMPVFTITILCDLITAMLAITLLKRMRARLHITT